MSVQAGTAYVPFEGDFSGLISGLSATLTSAQLKGAGRKGGMIIGGAIGAGIVAAGIGKALKTTVGAAVDWQSSFADVRKTVDASEKGYSRLAKGIRGMSRVIPTSANDLAELAGVAGQLGVKNRSILKFTRTVADLGETTNLHGEEAAKTLARIANIMQTSDKDYGRLGSTIVDLGNNMATTESEITEMALRLAKSGNQVGLSEDQVLSFSAALSSVGIEADAGGSAFSKAFINVAMAVSKGGEDLKNFADVAGMTSSKFSKLFEQDAARAMVALTEGLGRVREQGGNVFGVLEELGIKEVRMRDAMLGAAGAGDLFRRSLKLGSKAWKENTALADEAAQRYGTTKSQMQLLKNTWTDVMVSLGETVRPTWDRIVRRVRGSVAQIGKILGDPKLTGNEKFRELIELFTATVVQGIGAAAEKAFELAPDVAVAFAKGFASAPIWAQFATAGLVLRVLGGPGAITMAGTKAAGLFSTSFSSAMGTYEIARSFGRGRGVSAFAGIGSLALPMATTLMQSLKRMIPPLAATFAIGDVITTAISGDMKKALMKGGGGLAGAGIGAAIGSVFPVVGTAVGAAIGGGIGVGLGGAIDKLFGGGDSPMKTLHDRIVEGSKRVVESIRREGAMIGALSRSSNAVVRSRDRQRAATKQLKAAEQNALEAKRKYGANSVQAAQAEVRLARAKERSARATRDLRNAERLEGAQRTVTKKTLKSSAQVQKEVLDLRRDELKTARRELLSIVNSSASLKEKTKASKRYDRAATSVKNAQKDLNQTYDQAAKQIGPKFAKQLMTMTAHELRFGKWSTRIKKTVHANSSDMVKSFQNIGLIGPLQFKKAGKGAEKFDGTIKHTRTSVNRNMKQMPPVQRAATGMMVEDFTKKIGVVKNGGTPQAKRQGGLIRAVQQLRKGGVPVAVSSGEMFKTPQGEWGLVPGRPVAADNVLTRLPAGTKVFTDDGQRRLADGASEASALMRQRPHFASGGIVKPKITGGSPRARELGNLAIEGVHDKAVEKLKKVKQETAGGILGSLPGNLGKAMNLARSFGLTITSTTGGGHASNSWHYKGRAFDASNSGGPTPQMMGYFQEAAKRWGGRMLELFYDPAGWYIKNGGKVSGAIGGHSNHVHTAMRTGGLVQAIQALVKGGWVRTGYTTYSGSGGAWGDLGSKPAFAELGTATSGGVGTGVGYAAKALGMSGELPHNFPLEVKIGSKKGVLYKQDRGYGQGTSDYSVDVHTSGFSTVGLSGQNKGTAYIRTTDGSGDDPRGGGESQNQRRTRERKKKLAQLVKTARKAKSPLGKKGAWWKVLEAYAKWGSFGKGEGAHLLSGARGVASIANPNRGAGKLADLAGWLDRNVEMSGGSENKAMSRKLTRMKKLGGKTAEKHRKRIMTRIAGLSEKFKFTGRLKRIDHLIANTAEWIELAEREHSSEWSEGGSEYTEGEIDYERRLNESLLRLQKGKRGTLKIAIPYAKHLAGMYQQSILEARKNPVNRWRLPGFKRGRTAARDTLGQLREARTSLVGLTGKGGELGDTVFRLQELGVIANGSESNTEMTELLKEQLRLSNRNNALFAAQMPIFEQFLPRFHTGGVVPGRGEQPAMLLGGEGVFTPQQMAAIGGGGDTIVNVYVDPDAGINPDKIRVEIERVARERVSRVRRRTRTMA